MSEYAGPEPGEDYFAGSAITDWAAEHLTRGQDLLDSGPKTAGVEAGQEHWLKAQAQFMASIAVSLYEISQRPIAPAPEPPLDTMRHEATPSEAEHKVARWMVEQSSGGRGPQPTLEELREIISRRTREEEAQFITEFQEQESRAAGESYEPDLDKYENPDI